MINFSDVHLKEESADVVLGEVLPGIHKACLEHNDPLALCPGDFWHVRYRMPVKLQNAVRDELKRWGADGIHLLFIPGNHDQVDLMGRHAFEVFGDMENVTVFSQPTWTPHGLMVPYRRRPEDIAAALALPSPSKDYPRVVFMHHGIKGSMMNNGLVDTEGLDPGMFRSFQTVILGHYHKRQQWKVGKTQFYYVGSPWQTRADEAGQPKGYARWDGKKLTYVDTTWGKRFFQFTVEGEAELDLSGVRPEDEVRVRAGRGASVEALGKQLREAGVVRHTVTPVLDPIPTRLDVPEGATLREFVEAYVCQMNPELDRDQLFSVFEEIASPPQ